MEYKDIGDINSYSYRNSIYLEHIELPCFNLDGNSVRFGLDFQDYDDCNLKYKWEEILQKLIDLGKAQQPDEDNSEDEFYDDNNDDNYIYEDSNNDNYEPEDYYDDYGSGDYNDNDSYEDSSYVDITQKKENAAKNISPISLRKLSTDYQEVESQVRAQDISPTFNPHLIIAMRFLPLLRFIYKNVIFFTQSHRSLLVIWGRRFVRHRRCTVTGQYTHEHATNIKCRVLFAVRCCTRMRTHRRTLKCGIMAFVVVRSPGWSPS